MATSEHANGSDTRIYKRKISQDGREIALAQTMIGPMSHLR